MTLTFDLLTLKVVSESHVTWATSVPVLVFLGLSILFLGPMYATDSQTSDSRGHNNNMQWHSVIFLVQQRLRTPGQPTKSSDNGI